MEYIRKKKKNIEKNRVEEVEIDPRYGQVMYRGQRNPREGWEPQIS